MTDIAEEKIIEDEEGIEKEDTSSGRSVSITDPFNPNDIKIGTPPYSIGFLLDRLENDEINMNTDFQRSGNLWTLGKQSRLIESLLLGLPLPAFYFDTSNKKWDIIDGLQRCCSIYNFCVEKKLKLEELDYLKKLEGLGFDDLDRTLKRSILTRPITVNLLEKGAPRQVRYILFKRLNTGGLELKPQEIRNAIFQGDISSYIKKLARLREFEIATDERVPTLRMQDFDFVSRFLAFYINSYKNYQPDLDSFIIKSLETLESADKERLDVIESDFKRALNLAFTIFGNDAFRKRFRKEDGRNPINKAYFEVITVLLSGLNETSVKKLLEHSELLKENLLTLMDNPRYSSSLSGGTGTRDSVLFRFSTFEMIIKMTIGGEILEVK